MTIKDTGRITGYHAHIYFDADSEADAQAVRDAIDGRFDDSRIAKCIESRCQPSRVH